MRGRIDRKRCETLAAKAKAAELDEQIRVSRRRRIAAREAELKLLTATSARDLQKLDALRQHTSARTLQHWWCKRSSSINSSSSGATLRRSSAKRAVKSSTTIESSSTSTDDDSDMMYYTVPNRSVAIAAQRKESRHRYSIHQHAYDHTASNTTTAADRLSDVYQRVAAAANSTVTNSTVAHSMAHAAATAASVHSDTDVPLHDNSYSSRQKNSVHHKYETLLNAREQSNELLLQRQSDAVRLQAASKRRAELLQKFKELQIQLTHPPALTTATAATATAAPISSVNSVTAATAMRQWLPTDSKALARAVKLHERTVTTLHGRDRWYSTHLHHSSGGRAIDVRTMQSSDWPFENSKQPIKKHRSKYALYGSTATAAAAGTVVADDCEQSLWWHAYASKQRTTPLTTATADSQQQQQQQYNSSTSDRISQKLYEQVQLGPIARRENTLEYVHAKHFRIAQNVSARG